MIRVKTRLLFCPERSIDAGKVSALLYGTLDKKQKSQVSKTKGLKVKCK